MQLKSNEIVNTIDPRIKFIMLLAISTISVILKNILLLFIILIFEFIVFIIVRKRNFNPFSFLGKILWLSVPIMGFQIIFYYNPLFPIYIIPTNIPIFGGWILLSWDGIFYGGILLIRIIILLFSGAIFAMTTDRKDFLIALTKMKIPYIVSFMVSLAFYFLPLILTESDEVQMAMEAKGISIINGGIRSRLSNLKILLTTLFLNFVLNTNNMAMALQARGFRVRGDRTYYHEISISVSDIFILIFTILGSISLFFIMCHPIFQDYNFWGYGISIFDYWLFKLNGSCQLEIFYIGIF